MISCDLHRGCSVMEVIVQSKPPDAWSGMACSSDHLSPYGIVASRLLSWVGPEMLKGVRAESLVIA